MPMKTATKRIPNIYELFYDKQGNLLSSPDVISFKAQDNYANVLLINLEDGIEDNDLVLINFTPKNAVIDYTTHWFYVRPLKKIREYIIEGENAPRTFSTYLYEVPRIVLNNYVKNTTVENEITIIKRYGLNNLGVFNNYSDLTLDNPATKELYDTNAFAYVLNDQTIGSVLHKSGYYQVIEVSNGVYEWTIRENVMNYGLEQKQYEVKTAFTEAGYVNVDNVPNVEGTVVEALWRDLTSVINNIIDLQTFYELQFTPQETNTIALTFDKVTNNYFVVEANVKIDENNNDLLEHSSDGLYVKHDDTKADRTQEAWITPTLLNGWVNVGESDATLQYFKDSTGTVHIKGVINGGTATQIFTLPEGYRPNKIIGNVVYGIPNNSNIIIRNSGAVFAGSDAEAIYINTSFSTNTNGVT